MRQQQLWIGVMLLTLGASAVTAAPSKRAARAGARTHRVTKVRPAAKTVRTASRPAYRIAARPSGRTIGTRLAPARGRVGSAHVRRPLRRTLWAQAATGDGAGLVPATDNGTAAIPREAEPLMLRVLGAYYVTGDAPIRELRSRGWSFGDIATAGNLAARSGRPLYEVARAYEERRDWTMVARDLNVPADDVYVAVNSSRYVMVRPTPEEEAQIAAATPMPGESQIATATPVPEAPTGVAAPNTAVAPGTPVAPSAAAPPPTAVTPGTPVAPAAPATPVTPDTRATPATTGTPDATAPAAGATPTPEAGAAGSPVPPRSLTPAERVAASRLELAPRDQSAILRRAVATYYALPASTVRELESRGWNMGDVLVAGNLAYRSEATFEEVVALHDAGQDWSAVAGRIGVAAEDLYQPTMIRRVRTLP
jgi:hypothetical protein